MQKYIDKAILTINQDSPIIKAHNKIYYRNRLIDFASIAYTQDPQNFKNLYEWYKPNIIKSLDSAYHHGVCIGTNIGWITAPKTQKYYNELARVKKIIKNLTIS